MAELFKEKLIVEFEHNLARGWEKKILTAGRVLDKYGRRELKNIKEIKEELGEHGEVQFFSHQKGESLKFIDSIGKPKENVGPRYAIKKDPKKEVNMKCKCGQEAGESKFVDFDYAGLRFSHMAKDLSTCLECLKKETAKFFDKNGRELVSVVGGKIKVNWALYRTSAFVDEAEVSRRNKRTLLLEWLGILSARRSGNFVFEPDHLNICGSYIAKYAFTRLADAIEYGRSVCADKPDWAIEMVFEKTVLNKRDVKEMF